MAEQFGYHDHRALRQFNDAAEKVAGLGLSHDEAHELVVQAREAQWERDAEEASVPVVVDGREVAVIYAYADGVVEVRRVSRVPFILGEKL